jgi:hypothetical protein
MSTVLNITEFDIRAIRNDYWTVQIVLENAGMERLGPGQVIARQTLKDGSVRMVDFFNVVELAPGEKTKLTQLLSGVIKEIDFKTYRTNDGVTIPLSGVAKRGLFRWSLAS